MFEPFAAGCGLPTLFEREQALQQEVEELKKGLQYWQTQYQQVEAEIKRVQIEVQYFQQEACRLHLKQREDVRNEVEQERRNLYHNHLGSAINKLDEKVIKTILATKQLLVELKRGHPERSVIISLFASSFSAKECCTMLGVGSKLLKKVSHNTGPKYYKHFKLYQVRRSTKCSAQAGVIPREPKEPRTCQRVTKVTLKEGEVKEIPFAELREMATAYYMKRENSEYKCWKDCRSGLQEETIVGKKQIKEIYENWVAEYFGGIVPCSYGFFKDCRPTGWMLKGFTECVCGRCKEAKEMCEQMWKLLAAVGKEKKKQKKGGSTTKNEKEKVEGEEEDEGEVKEKVEREGEDKREVKEKEKKVEVEWEEQEVEGQMEEKVEEEEIKQKRVEEVKKDGVVEEGVQRKKQKGYKPQYKGLKKELYDFLGHLNGLPTEVRQGIHPVAALVLEQESPGDVEEEVKGWEKKSCEELKTECRKRGMKVSGNKQQLVERLVGREGSKAYSNRKKRKKEAEKSKQKGNTLPCDIKFLATLKEGCSACEQGHKIAEGLRAQIQALTTLTTEIGWGEVIDKAVAINWTYHWEWGMLQWKHHQWESGNQFKAFEDHLTSLKLGEELWVFDFAMTIALTQSIRQTREQWMKREYANCFGLVRFWRKKKDDEKGKEKGNEGSEEGELLREYHLFLSEDAVHDSYYAICCLDLLMAEAKQRQVRLLILWSDNGNHFHATENFVWLVRVPTL